LFAKNAKSLDPGKVTNAFVQTQEPGMARIVHALPKQNGLERYAPAAAPKYCRKATVYALRLKY